MEATGDEDVLEWLDQRITDGIGSGEVIIWKVRDPIEEKQPVREKGRVQDYETVTTDHGVDDKRLLIQEPEFATILKVTRKDSSLLSPVLRKAWESGRLRNTTKTSNAEATDAHISVIGHITQSELKQLLDSNESANGFGNRFLWVYAKRNRELAFGGNLDSDQMDLLASKLKQAINFARTAGELIFSEEARPVWKTTYHQLTQDKPGLYGSIVGRSEPQVLRLAILYALLDQSNVIHPRHINAAKEVWRYCDDSARTIFGNHTGNRTADKILSALQRANGGEVTRTEIRDLLGRKSSAIEIDSAIDALVELEMIEVGTQTTNGRPVTLVRLATNPTKGTKGVSGQSAKQVCEGGEDAA